jgi:hypothetical protein
MNNIEEKEIHASGYTFYLREFVDIEDNTVELTIVSKRKQPYPCVRIELDTRPSKTNAYLQSVQYYGSCSINQKELERHSGTILMIQIALKYAIEKYTYIKRFHLQDETFIDIPSKPLITARRLLNGQRGWYEEHLHAKPGTEPLTKILHFLRKPDTNARVKALLPPESVESKWWTPNHIHLIADQVKQGLFLHLIGSPWIISAKTIQSYEVSYTESPITLQKGGYYRRRMNTILSNSHKSYVYRHGVAPP